MALVPSTLDKNHARTAVSEISGGVKSWDAEKGGYVEVKKVEPVEVKEVDKGLLKDQLKGMSRQEVCEAMEEHFNQKIDRTKFRKDSTVLTEAYRIIDSFM